MPLLAALWPSAHCTTLATKRPLPSFGLMTDRASDSRSFDMLTEQDYIDRLLLNWPESSQDVAPQSLIDLAEEAVDRHPQSWSLWHYLGNIYVMSSSANQPRHDPTDCYQRAVSLNPMALDAWESLGCWLDIKEQFHSAEDAFRHAISLGGSPDSYAGLARVCAQTGRQEEAMRVLRVDCPFATHPLVKTTRREIEQGVWT